MTLGVRRLREKLSPARTYYMIHSWNPQGCPRLPICRSHVEEILKGDIMVGSRGE